MGPFIIAYLKVHGEAQGTCEQALKWLAPFQEHLKLAGLGSISEIFDGDAPHLPRGCIAQAWSVAELLRAAAYVSSMQQSPTPKAQPSLYNLDAAGMAF
jgi:glycogen debranching enzyme